MSSHGHEPEYGQRIPHRDLPAPAPAPRPSPASPRAARRMARGLSFTLIMLGVLLGAGLAAQEVVWGWVVGALLAAPGAAGFVAVQAQLHPALRDPAVPPLRSRSRWWLVPAALLLLGLLPLAGAFAVGPALEGTARADLVDEYVSVLVVAGMTLVVSAALGFGLVAMATFTRPDDDDSPLRPTGYAERLRRTDPREHYDSDWIRRGRGPRHGPDGGPSPGGPPRV